MKVSRYAVLAVLIAFPACAQKAPPPASPPAGKAMSDTVTEITSHGILMVTKSGKFDIYYSPDGRLEGSLGMVGGTWSADGAKLCISVPGFAENQCLTYPDGKKSGDAFVVEADSGPISIVIH